MLTSNNNNNAFFDMYSEMKFPNSNNNSSLLNPPHVGEYFLDINEQLPPPQQPALNSAQFSSSSLLKKKKNKELFFREKFQQLSQHLNDLNHIKNAFVEKYEEMKKVVETVLDYCDYTHEENDSINTMTLIGKNSNMDPKEEKEDISNLNFLDDYIPFSQFLQQQQQPEQESHTCLMDCSSQTSIIPKTLSSISLFRCASSESLMTSLTDSILQQFHSPEHDATSSGSAITSAGQSSMVLPSSDFPSNGQSSKSISTKRQKSAKSNKRKKQTEKKDSIKKVKKEESTEIQLSIDNFSQLTREEPIDFTPQNQSQTYGEFNWIGSFGSSGSVDGQFDGPVDIKYLSRRDFLLIAEYNNKRIQIFDAKTLEYKYQIPTESEIRGIALDPTNDNSILVSCDDSIVSRYTIMESWHVEMYGSKGSKSNQFNGPTGMVIDEEGRIFVCDCMNSRIQVLSREGQFLYSFGEKGTRRGQFLMPWSITIDPFGNLLITDSGNHRIEVYSPSGEHLNEIGRKGSSKFEFNTPRSIIVDQITGNVLICDEGNNRIQILNSTLSQHVKTIENRLYSPTGITLDPTRALLYVSEWDLEHNTIQIFK